MPAKTTSSKKKSVDFEQSLTTLETLVERMEQGDMTLEESLKAFETGIALTRECQTRLAAAEQQVTQLIAEQDDDEEGYSLEPFDDDEDEN
jgi:exodeoxyribonuclease VII small subunit